MHKRILAVLVINIFILVMGRFSFAAIHNYSNHTRIAQSYSSDMQDKADVAVEAVPETKVDVGNKICPVSGEKISDVVESGMKPTIYEYKGKIYNFCCPMCIEEFKKDPEKYIAKMKEVNLEAYQFGFSPDAITVNKGDIVTLLLTSRDVTHGINIKAYGINVPVKKGEVQRIDFIADKVGEFDILCSVYCGAGHSQMKARLIVEE